MSEKTDIFRGIAAKAENDMKAMGGFPGSAYPAHVARAGLDALDELEATLAQAQADVEALQKHRRALESMLERLAVWFERTAEDELAASVELPSAEKMGAYLRQRLWEEKIDFLPEHLRREGR